MTEVKKTYQDVSDEIDLILVHKKHFWNLNAISHIGYDDVCQIIRLHIWNKFDQWNQERPFGPWCSKLVSRQILNIQKKVYGRYAPPCRGCEFNLGDGRCSLNMNGLQSGECDKYREWQIKKESTYRLILPERTDKMFDIDPDGEPRVKVEAPPERDYQHAADKLHILIMEKLDDKKKQIYRWLYIENRSDEFLAEQMGLKTSELGQKPGYRQIFNIKKSIIAEAKAILAGRDIFATE